jgi:hypothetical protein
MPKKIEIGRLALRQEGEWWNAYWAPNQHNMTGSVLMGTIRLNLVKGATKEHFIALMCEAFSKVTEDIVGQTPEWTTPHPAPENERSGNA